MVRFWEDAAVEQASRFDIEEVAKAELAENQGKFAIVAGEIEHSELVPRIFSEDETLMMPPPDSNLKLTEQEKLILKKWIEQGAIYEQHWAFNPPKKAEPPKVRTSNWAENEIDYFVLKGMEENNLKPSEEASKEKLIRRLSLDLTGLPPTVEELENFVFTAADFEYDKIVDHYLAKPAYGEMMTRQWLDVSRYADSHGYQDDSYRTMWPGEIGLFILLIPICHMINF